MAFWVGAEDPWIHVNLDTATQISCRSGPTPEVVIVSWEEGSRPVRIAAEDVPRVVRYLAADRERNP